MQITVYSSWKIFCLAYFLEGSMQENDFSTSIVCLLIMLMSKTFPLGTF